MILDILIFKFVDSRMSSSSSSLVPRTKKKMLLDEVREELRELKVDGASTIFDPRRLLALRIVWLALILCSASMCSYLIVQSVGEYLHYEVTTRTRLITEIAAIFPTIYVCNQNPFTTPYADALFAAAGINNSLSNLAALEDHMLRTSGAYLSDAQKANMSDMRDFLISCKFSSIDCSVDDFDFVYVPNFGNCYRFNGGRLPNSTNELRSVFLAGSFSSLTLQLYAGLTDAQNYAGASVFKAFNVLVLNQTTYPFWYDSPFKFDSK